MATIMPKTFKVKVAMTFVRSQDVYKGPFETIDDLNNVQALDGDYADVYETGTRWQYVNDTWTNTGYSIPIDKQYVQTKNVSVLASPNTVAQRDENGHLCAVDGEALQHVATISQLRNAQQALQNVIDDEQNARINEDNKLQESIENEIERATGKEASLEASIQGLNDSITAENARAKAAEKELQSNIDATNAALQQETQRAELAESTNANAIEAEQNARIAADNKLTQDLNAEASTREAQDTNLTTAINDETSRATIAEGKLQQNIDAAKALSDKQNAWLSEVDDALTAPVKIGDNLTALYFDTQKTPDLSVFTYTPDEDVGFYTAGLIGLRASEIVGYLSAVKVNDTVYALIYENRATGDISYLYVSDNIEYGGTSFSKGWQNFNNPFPVTSATVVDVDQTATKPWNGIWVSKKAFYARTDEIPAEPNNGTLTIQKNGTTVGTFGANQSENTTANIDVPTKVSQLQNDAGYTKNKGTVISILLNGTTYTADNNGLVDLGTISGGTAYRSIYNEIY